MRRLGSWFKQTVIALRLVWAVERESRDIGSFLSRPFFKFFLRGMGRGHLPHHFKPRLVKIGPLLTKLESSEVG